MSLYRVMSLAKRGKAWQCLIKPVTNETEETSAIGYPGFFSSRSKY